MILLDNETIGIFYYTLQTLEFFLYINENIKSYYGPIVNYLRSLVVTTLKLPPTKSMADASGTSRPRWEMTTASSTSWCSDSSGSGISTAAVATPAWRNDEVGFRNRTGSCNTPKHKRDQTREPHGKEGEGSWKGGSVLGSRMGGAQTAPLGPGCRAPWRGLRSCAQRR